MSTSTIMVACFDHLDDFVYQPQPVIVWPGVPTNPPESGVWLEPGFFPNEPIDRSWDNEACIEVRGFFQILVYFRPRPKTGILSPAKLADALIAHFPKGLELGSVRVRKKAWQSPLIKEDSSKSYIPVTVSYLGLTK